MDNWSEHRRVFEDIYTKKLWGDGSGSGSRVENCFPLIGWLQYFIREHGVADIIDFGCGDWQWMRYVNLSGVSYLGIDVVQSLIDENRLVHGASNIKFQIAGNLGDLPNTDCVLFKDVLQHLPNSTVHRILREVTRKARFIVSINGTKLNVNNDIITGGYRSLDLKLPPFNLPATSTYTYNVSGEQEKLIQILENQEVI